MENQNLDEVLMAAQEGNPAAQYRMGLRCYYGQDTLQNYKEAVRWFKMAAEQGYSYAQCNLGICYRKGEGILIDYMEARRLFQMAAEKGDLTAVYNLGLCYYYGQGAVQDFEKAADMFRKAAELSNAGENHELGGFHQEELPEPSTYEELLPLYRETAVKLGNLQMQLQNEILKKDGASFANDSNILKIKDLTEKNEKLQNEISECKEKLQTEISECRETIESLHMRMEEQEKAFEEEKESILSDSRKKAEQLNSTINQLKNRCDENVSTIARLEREIAGLEEESEKREALIRGKNGEIDVKNRAIEEKNQMLEKKQREIQNKSDQIEAHKKTIEDRNKVISQLKTQKPFVKKVNVLRWMDILSMILICAIMIENHFFAFFIGDSGFFRVILVLGIIIGQLLLQLCLSGEKYMLHAVFCFIMAAPAAFFAMYISGNSLFRHDLFGFIFFFPYVLILLWNSIVSVRKEIFWM